MGYIHKRYATPGGISRQVLRIVGDECAFPMSVYSSAGCQLGQQEVPGGGEQGDPKGGRGPRLGRTTLPRPMRASCC
jgi:hypothetical protein